MKKFLLSLAIVVLFIFYSTYKQNNNALLASNVTPTNPPPDVNSPTPSPSPTNPPTPNINNQPTAAPPLPTDTVAPQSPGNGRMMGKPMMGQYKDGVYTGDTVDVFYGNVQIQATISGGRISDVKFLQSPSDRQTSVEINSQAMPMLQSEALQAQSANVDGVSGASATSQGFVASLGSALAKAK